MTSKLYNDRKQIEKPKFKLNYKKKAGIFFLIGIAIITISSGLFIMNQLSGTYNYFQDHININVANALATRGKQITMAAYAIAGINILWTVIFIITNSIILKKRQDLNKNWQITAFVSSILLFSAECFLIIGAYYIQNKIQADLSPNQVIDYFKTEILISIAGYLATFIISGAFVWRGLIKRPLKTSQRSIANTINIHQTEPKQIMVDFYHKHLIKRRTWHLVYKWIFFGIGIFVVFGLYIYQLFIPPSYLAALNRNDFSMYYFSYFTIQTNILLLVWYAFAIFYHRYEGISLFTSSKTHAAITTYISVTSLVFIAGVLVPGSVLKNKYDTVSLIGTVFLHGVFPLAFIIYFFITPKIERISWVDIVQRLWWFMIIYPLAYFIFVMFRGELRYQEYHNLLSYAQQASGDLKERLNALAEAVKESSYPYFFLNVRESGFGWFWLSLIGVVVVFIGFNSLYYLYINKSAKNKWFW